MHRSAGPLRSRKQLLLMVAGEQCAGLLMTAYLKSLGMTEAVLSLFRGVGAASGVAATFTYPVLHRKLGEVLGYHTAMFFGFCWASHLAWQRCSATLCCTGCLVFRSPCHNCMRCAQMHNPAPLPRSLQGQYMLVEQLRAGRSWTQLLLNGHLNFAGGLRAGTLGIWAQAGCLWLSIAPSLAAKLGGNLPAPLVSCCIRAPVAKSDCNASELAHDNTHL